MNIRPRTKPTAHKHHQKKPYLSSRGKTSEADTHRQILKRVRRWYYPDP